MKRMKSLLLSMVMLVSVLPMAGFRSAEDTAKTVKVPVLEITEVNKVLKSLSEENPGETGGETDVDPQDAIDALNDAEQAAHDAEQAVAPGTIKDLEKEAEQAENDAINSINAALERKEEAEKKLAEYADKAEEAEKAVKNNYDAANQDRTDAGDAEKDADKQEFIAEHTWIYPIADHAAWEAYKDAQNADTSVADALNQKEAAASNLEEAKKNSDAAKAEYDQAVKDIQDALDAGYLSAEKAEAKTKEAEEKAARVAKALDIAEQDAIAAAQDAQDALDDAKNELADAIWDLNEVIKENGETTLNDTGVAAATGTALAVVKIVTDVAEVTVNSLENKEADLKEQIADLDEKIETADKAIGNLEQMLEDLDAEDAEYPQAVKALEAATEARDAAVYIRDNAKAIDDERTAAETADVKNALDEIKNGSTDPDVLKTVSEYVLKNMNTYTGDDNKISKDATVDTKGGLIVVKDGDNTFYFEPVVQEEKDGETVTNRYVQLKEITYVPVPTAKADMKDLYDELDRTKETDFTVTYNETEYPVYIRRNGNAWTGYSYEYYIKANNKSYPVTQNNDKEWVVNKQVVSMESPVDEVKEVKNSNSTYVTDGWKYSEELKDLDPEAQLPEDYKNYLDEKSAAVTEATENFEQAEKEYENTKSNINFWLTRLNGYKEGKVADRDELQTELDATDKKLNGNAFDKIVVDVVDGVSVAEILLKALFGQYGSIGTDDVQNAITVGSDLLKIYNAISSGNFDEETMEALSNILTGDLMAERTKYAMASRIEEKVAEMHHEAVVKLQGDVDAGLEAVKEATARVGEGTVSVAEKRLVLDVAEATQKLATALSDEADAEAEKARIAHEKAEAALTEVTNLMNAGIEVSQKDLDRASAAAENAQKAADQADIAYSDAAKSAQNARISAIQARRAANRLRPFARTFFRF